MDAENEEVGFDVRGWGYVKLRDGSFADASDEFERYLFAVRVWGANHCYWCEWPKFWNEQLGVWLFAPEAPSEETWKQLADYIRADIPEAANSVAAAQVSVVSDQSGKQPIGDLPRKPVHVEPAPPEAETHPLLHDAFLVENTDAVGEIEESADGSPIVELSPDAWWRYFFENLALEAAAVVTVFFFVPGRPLLMGLLFGAFAYAAGRLHFERGRVLMPLATRLDATAFAKVTSAARFIRNGAIAFTALAIVVFLNVMYGEDGSPTASRAVFGSVATAFVVAYGWCVGRICMLRTSPTTRSNFVANELHSIALGEAIRKRQL